MSLPKICLFCFCDVFASGESPYLCLSSDRVCRLDSKVHTDNSEEETALPSYNHLLGEVIWGARVSQISPEIWLAKSYRGENRMSFEMPAGDCGSVGRFLLHSCLFEPLGPDDSICLMINLQNLGFLLKWKQKRQILGKLIVSRKFKIKNKK